MQEFKKDLLTLFKRGLQEIVTPFNGYPKSFFDYNHPQRSRIGQLDREQFNTMFKDKEIGDMNLIEDGLMCIFYRHEPALVIGKYRINVLEREVEFKTVKEPRKFLGITTGYDEYREPVESIDNTKYKYSYRFDDKVAKLCKKEKVYVIKHGKIMAQLTEAEYEECKEHFRQRSIDIDYELMRKRIKRPSGA